MSLSPVKEVRKQSQNPKRAREFSSKTTATWNSYILQNHCEYIPLSSKEFTRRGHIIACTQGEDYANPRVTSSNCRLPRRARGPTARPHSLFPGAYRSSGPAVRISRHRGKRARADRIIQIPRRIATAAAAAVNIPSSRGRDKPRVHALQAINLTARWEGSPRWGGIFTWKHVYTDAVVKSGAMNARGFDVDEYKIAVQVEAANVAWAGEGPVSCVYTWSTGSFPSRMMRKYLSSFNKRTQVHQ